jgi:putative membrane protein
VGKPAWKVGSDPDYRFSLANERTFLAWIRTAMGLLAGGVAVIGFLDVGHPGVRLAAGIALLALALALPPLAYRRWAASERALRTEQSLPEPGLLRLMAGGLAVVGLLVVAVLIT